MEGFDLVIGCIFAFIIGAFIMYISTKEKLQEFYERYSKETEDRAKEILFAMKTKFKLKDKCRECGKYHGKKKTK